MQVFITGGGVAAVEGDLSGGSGYLVMISGGGVWPARDPGDGPNLTSKHRYIIYWMPVMGYDSVVDKPELISGFTVSLMYTTRAIGSSEFF